MPVSSPLLQFKIIDETGDYIVIDSTIVHDGAFTLTLGWSPNDSLKGYKRDSAITSAMQDPLSGVPAFASAWLQVYAVSSCSP